MITPPVLLAVATKSATDYAVIALEVSHVGVNSLAFYLPAATSPLKANNQFQSRSSAKKSTPPGVANTTCGQLSLPHPGALKVVGLLGPAVRVTSPRGTFHPRQMQDAASPWLLNPQPLALPPRRTTKATQVTATGLHRQRACLQSHTQVRARLLQFLRSSTIRSALRTLQTLQLLIPFSSLPPTA